MENTNESLYEDIVTGEEELEISEEVTDEPDEASSDEISISKAELNKLKRKAIAYESLKGKAQESKPAQNQETTINNSSSSLSREEAMLIAKGFNEDDLDYLNVVAKGTGLSLKDAQEHPLFVTYTDKINADKKSKRATMSTSKGSTATKQVNLTNMSAEDHKKYWAEKMGR